MHWWESGICVSSGFSNQVPCNLRELVDHLSKFSKDTVLLWSLQSTIAIPLPSWAGWLWSLEALVADLGMSLFLADIPHQSHRPSFSGQRLVCWPPRSDLRFLPLFLCFRRVGLWDTDRHLEPCTWSSLRWRDLVFWTGTHARFFVLREITGHSGRALVPEKGQWMSYVEVLPPGAAHTTCIRPDSQCSRLFLPTAVQPIGTYVHRRLGVCYRGCLL